ncbi:endolytic transglycosylase MltG [Pengzhenrongella frigida]|uniref:endolytic transglycosylase MltG n=1 Tax=Pengzhenrongella frigida TaxID=1259133 RepID=UPI001F5D57FA|nr:endolytic transglycosylase MltG [Cellulomonas sp. HLT2-17]
MGEIFAAEESAGESHDAAPAQPSRSRRRTAGKAAKRRRRRRSTVLIVIAALLLAGGAYVVVDFLAPLFSGDSTEEIADYPGPGHGSVQVVVNPGDTGTAIGATLAEAGVVATQKAFSDAYRVNVDAPSIQPGSYDLLLEMSGADAVVALLDPARRVSYKVTVPEGLTADQIYERVSAITTIPVADLAAAAADPAIGLPAEAGGNIEGWLFPATYSFEPGSTATSVLTQMIAQTVAVFDTAGVPVEQRQAVLIKASLVEREGRSAEDRAKIAQAIENRLGREMKLDIDASLAYGLGKPGTGLTNADKESDSPFNLYRVTGLPPTPIASPGEESITAVLNPTPGDWLFWVAINLDTGETLFANNLADHDENVAKLRAWQAANPG